MKQQCGTSKPRISEIELMRFAAAFIIMGHHFLFVFDKGWILVEFFFILSGILMAQSAEKTIQSKKQLDLGNDAKNFIIRKIKTLLPYLIIAYLSYITIYLILGGFTSTLANDILNQIPDYLLLIDAGFNVEGYLMDDATWYISAMIIGLMILYPIYLRLGNLGRYVVMPLIFIFCIGFLIHTGTTMNFHRQWIGFASGGMIRGIGEMALGAFCYTICTHLKKIELTTIGNIITTMMKILLITITVIWSMGYLHTTKDFVIIFIIAGFLIIMYSEKGYNIPKGSRICTYLGTLSIPIFILHRPISAAMKNFIGAEWFNENLLLAMVIVIVISAIVVAILDYGKEHGFFERIKGIFITGNE